jgi:hypothetical protein
MAAYKHEAEDYVVHVTTCRRVDAAKPSVAILTSIPDFISYLRPPNYVAGLYILPETRRHDTRQLTVIGLQLILSLRVGDGFRS